jgi:hypothetical protein
MITPGQAIAVNIGHFNIQTAVSSAPGLGAVANATGLLDVVKFNRIFGRGNWQIRVEYFHLHTSNYQFVAEAYVRTNTAAIQTSATKTVDVVVAAGAVGRISTIIILPSDAVLALDRDTSADNVSLSCGKGTTAVGNPSLRGVNFYVEPRGTQE